MPTQDKVPAEFYAQTAAFVYEGTHDYHSLQLGRKIGEVATSFMAGENVMHVEEKWNGQKVETTYRPSQYMDFLRRAGPETRADIAFLTDRMEAFEKFRETADTARGDFLGRGSNGSAFRITQEGADYVLKTGGVTYQDVRAFRRGAHIEGISHLEAIDLDNRRSVMNLVPGKDAGKMSHEERMAIPRERIKQVVAKTIEMSEAGLFIDPKASNFLYDEQKGFGIIDYHALPDKQGSGEMYHVARQVLNLQDMLSHRPIDYSSLPKNGTAEYDQWDLQYKTEKVQILNRLLDVLEEDFPEIVTEGARLIKMDRENPNVGTQGLYDIYDLPEGEFFASFAERVRRLGLEGDPPYEPPKDAADRSVVEMTTRVVSHDPDDDDYVM